MFSLLAAVLLMNPAQAACDAKALNTQVTEAAPQAVAEVYTQLAACDPAGAKKAAATVLPRMVASDKANEAAVAALRVGASAEVLAWAKNLQPDERGPAISYMGEVCQANKDVQSFFLSAASTMGDAFWNERWFRGLATCRVPEVQKLLGDEIARSEKTNQSRFLGVLEVYSRNLGGAAVPRLKELALSTQDAETQTYIINALSDAAGLGAKEGADGATAAAAIKAIIELAPQLQPKAVEQARTTLNALGDERAADELAGVRYKDVRTADGKLMYGAVIVETATCKNGKTQQAIHAGQLLDPGHTWPDQMRGKVESVTVSWGFDLAQKCKGEGKLDTFVPAEPFKDADAYKSWVESQVKEIQKAPVDKRIRLDHDPLPM